jgi:predicted transcriptional regulator
MMAARGELERSILEALWDRDEAMTARDVAAALPGRDLAMTTVLTVLDRLRHKGSVLRDRAARPHTYRAAQSRDAYVAQVMLDALGQTEDRAAALTRFLGGVRDTDTAHLRAALRRRPRG